MIRQIQRAWHCRRTGRARAALLLIVWVASVVLTITHDDGGAAAGAARGRRGNAGPTLAASCGADGSCHDPTHHHAPLGHHDVTQCPYCALFLERPAGLPGFSFAPPTTVRFVVAEPVLRLSCSQRCACALARGLPAVRPPV